MTEPDDTTTPPPAPSGADRLVLIACGALMVCCAGFAAVAVLDRMAIKRATADNRALLNDLLRFAEPVDRGETAPPPDPDPMPPPDPDPMPPAAPPPPLDLAAMHAAAADLAAQHTPSTNGHANGSEPPVGIFQGVPPASWGGGAVDLSKVVSSDGDSTSAADAPADS